MDWRPSGFGARDHVFSSTRGDLDEVGLPSRDRRVDPLLLSGLDLGPPQRSIDDVAERL